MTTASKYAADLRARFRGALLQPGEEGYDETRTLRDIFWDRPGRTPRPDRLAP